MAGLPDYLGQLRALKAAKPDLFVVRLNSEKDPAPAIQEALEHVDGACTRIFQTCMTISVHKLLDLIPM
jgi:hypothetical protein